MTFFLGLTGSIGMGKSTTARFFADLGIPVWDADEEVHALYAKNGAAVAPIAALYPAAVVDGAIDRSRLKNWIAADKTALKRIESVVHPLVAKSREDFMNHMRAQNKPLAVLDIPLLFENGSEHLCDAILVVTASPEVQRQRVLQRPGMTDAHFEAMLAKQMPDLEKRGKADYVLETRSPDQTRAAVRALIDKLTGV